MYLQGQGVAKNDEQAAYWYHQAAERGHTAAQCNIGAMYGNGQGVAKDYVEAHKWLNLAAANCDEIARSARDVAERQMSREQIADAERRASEWLKTHGK